MSNPLRRRTLLATSQRASPLLALALALALTLTACSYLPIRQDSTPIGVPSTSPVPESPVPVPSATVRAATFIMPKDCRNVVGPADYSRVFHDTPINHPNFVGVSGPPESGVVVPRAAPGGATPEVTLRSAIEMSCLWADPRADKSHLLLTIATVTPAVAETFLTSLQAKGYSCSAAHGGRMCQMVGQNEQNGVAQGDTAFLRDDIYLTVGQANFPTSDLIGTLTAHLWK